MSYIKWALHILEVNATALSALCALCGVCIAYTGLRSWRTTMQGAKEYESAFGLLRASLNLRNAIQAVRNPFISAEESGAALQEKGIKFETIPSKDEREKQIQQGMAAAYERRWKLITDTLTTFDVAALDAKILWGESVEKLTNELRNCVLDLNIELNDYLRSLWERGKSEQTITERKIRDKIIYNTGIDNAFTCRIKEIVSDLESLMRPVVRSKVKALNHR